MNFFVPWLMLLLLWVNHPRQQERYEYAEQKMGTTFRLVFYADDLESADRAASAVFKRVDELNNIFSDYQEDSEISTLSRSSGSSEFVRVSDEMWEVLSLAKKVSELSEGAFDITAGPLTKLWRRAIRRQEFPEREQLEDAQRQVSYLKIQFDSTAQSVRLSMEGMRLDAGGIAKGYTVDQAYTILMNLGIKCALVDGGGDIFAGDPPPGKDGWEIMINCQGGKEKQLVVSNTAVASSGDTFKYLDWQGKRYSHIVDPRTGTGVIDSNVVNVMAPTCVVADALASAWSVLGEAPLERAFPGVIAACY